MVALPLPSLPREIATLQHLALDLRWTWNHEADALWAYIDKSLWERTHNPWVVLQSTSRARLEELAHDRTFSDMLATAVAARERYRTEPGWFRRRKDAAALGGVAYFSMEFGLGAALPLYAGGLGVLAGDYLKAASDLDVPIVGIGLLYQEGYFRQIIDAAGDQQEFYPYNEPAALPIQPVMLENDGWLRIPLELPGRSLQLRVWQALVGRIKLYLLDSNDVLNSPPDRGITAKLYGGGTEMRLLQEIVLGVGGWRAIEALHPEIDICHVNEGHAAFAIIERARHLALKAKLDFWEALWATRAGNLFTTHTPVAAGFDQFSADLLRKYMPYVEGVTASEGVGLREILALGRLNANDDSEPFNMAFLALRGSAMSVGVSRLHGEFSRRIFQPLFPRWPACEVPVSHITNGVHVPTWDSAEADKLWTDACGKERWRALPQDGAANIASLSDDTLWAVRARSRERVVRLARTRLASQLRERGFGADVISVADTVLDANVLTLGFARRFTEYKRPNLLLSNPERFGALLRNAGRPVQIVVAGKAHPADATGKRLIRNWIEFARRPEYRRHVVFLEDYDMDLAQELVQGVDVWINTPRRPWEACGTSGMKVLVNGGINCSIRDGWWDEAYAPDVGWAVGGDEGGAVESVDARDADSLYRILETEVVPEFYNRDAEGLPKAWLQRIRNSMSKLTAQFGAARMMQNYVEQTYLPLANGMQARSQDNYERARDLNEWWRAVSRRWPTLHIGTPAITRAGDTWHVSVAVYMGEVPPSWVRVEMFADARDELEPEVIVLHQERPMAGSMNGYIYSGAMETTRPATDYTARAVAFHPDAQLPLELPLITWQR